MFATLYQKFYVPDRGDFQLSGQFSLVGVLLSTGLSALTVSIAAYIYSLAVAIIPIIYFNILLTGVLAIVIGYCVNFFCKLALIRNDKVRLLIGLSVGFWGLIIQWLVYLFFLNTGKAPLFNSYAEGEYLLSSEVLQILFNELYTNGNWSVFGFTVSGWVLLSIWLGEALIIIGGPILILLKNPISPFSERLMKWYPKISLAQDFAYVSTISSFIKELRKHKGANLLHYPKGDGMRHSVVSLYYIDKEGIAYISVDNIFISKGEKASKDVDPVIQFVAIPSITAQELIDKYGKRKWSYLSL